MVLAWLRVHASRTRFGSSLSAGAGFTLPSERSPISWDVCRVSRLRSMSLRAAPLVRVFITVPGAAYLCSKPFRCWSASQLRHDVILLQHPTADFFLPCGRLPLCSLSAELHRQISRVIPAASVHQSPTLLRVSSLIEVGLFRVLAPLSRPLTACIRLGSRPSHICLTFLQTHSLRIALASLLTLPSSVWVKRTCTSLAAEHGRGTNEAAAVADDSRAWLRTIIPSVTHRIAVPRTCHFLSAAKTLACRWVVKD